MVIKSENDIIQLVEKDQWMMDIIRSVKRLQLPDWWICAGFVRSKIWDVQQGFTERTKLPDVDVIYYDKSNTDEKTEKKIRRKTINDST
ncbi:nucleotidyltransferase family protein [Bacillus carboniphilus]|uniref:nucleotidyltransferase family protein n=1 Tax=Bacillus carboniphilus TaxID=86663 RepID=UPI0035320D07